MALTSFQRKDHLDDNFPVQGSPIRGVLQFFLFSFIRQEKAKGSVFNQTLQ